MFLLIMYVVIEQVQFQTDDNVSTFYNSYREDGGGYIVMVIPKAVVLF